MRLKALKTAANHNPQYSTGRAPRVNQVFGEKLTGFPNRKTCQKPPGSAVPRHISELNVLLSLKRLRAAP